MNSYEALEASEHGRCSAESERDEWRHRAQAAEAEVERLRAALERERQEIRQHVCRTAPWEGLQ